MNEVIGNPIFRLLFVIVFVYIMLPSLFSYTTIKSTLVSYNICFVGPTSIGIKNNQLNNEILKTKKQKLSLALHYRNHLPTSTSSETKDEATSSRKPKTTEESLYGTYQSYKHTNYYFIQRLYPVEEYLFGCTNFYIFGSTSDINANKKCGWPNGLIISSTLNKITMRLLKNEWISRQRDNDNNFLN